MRTFKNMAAQGDFIIIRVNKVPDNVEAINPEKDKFVLAHSETGHNHVIDRASVEVFKTKGVAEADLYQLFMVVKEPSTIDHLRSHDTHESLLVTPGNYEIRRQREYTPEGFRRAAD